jgi:formylglycine-generating enzyme required for sulfatase activity
MRLSSPGLQQYLDQAVGFRAGPQPLRVARTLLTCGLAVAVLNEMGAPAEAGSAYNHINVHNPGCPLRFWADEGRWACAPALEDHPVWGINWAGATWICRHLGARLPRAHEWECFASNNDPQKKYPWGNAAPTPLLANFSEHFGGTSRVGSFPPSELGLFDLAGNLGEWCDDACPVPGGPPSAFERLVKGGAWSQDARRLEIAACRGKWERLGTTTIGIRPVWDD